MSQNLSCPGKSVTSSIRLPLLARSFIACPVRGDIAFIAAKPKHEATVVKKLREHGAVILGKTTLTEWANYRSPGKAPNGWAATGGQCYGVFVEDQDPGGSSSGSGVAVALGLAPAALATEVMFSDVFSDLGD